MALVNINRCLLLPILLIVFCILHNHSEAEAVATTPLTKTSIDPPFGNSLIQTVNASGVQIYECEENSNATGLVYTSVGAMATLYSPDGVNGNDTSVGYHYFLTWPLAEGGKPTYSFSVKAGDPISAIPESTVTGTVLAKQMLNSEDVADLLLKAVSHSGYGNAIWVSYVQRRHSTGGVPPTSQCEEVGKQVQIPYSAQYLLWQQDQ